MTSIKSSAILCLSGALPCRSTFFPGMDFVYYKDTRLRLFSALPSILRTTASGAVAQLLCKTGQLLRATSQQNWNRNSQQPKQNVPGRTTVLIFLAQAHVTRSFLCLLIRMRNETHVLQTRVLANPLFR